MKKLIIISLVLVVLDQLTKYIFSGKEYLINQVGIKYVENSGAAFGILKGWSLFLIIVSIGVLGLILIYYKKFEWKLPLILIFAGTLGNLIDRIAFGFVRDFLMVWIWPVFNIADACNTIGVLLLAYYFWKEDKTYKQKTLKK